MAYLTKKKGKKGQPYYQIVEAYREGGRVRKRVLLHLGTDLASADTLMKWWNYLGQPRVPSRAGVPGHLGPTSLATPCETIIDMDKFLFLRDATAEDRQRAAEGLKFLMEQPAGS